MGSLINFLQRSGSPREMVNVQFTSSICLQDPVQWGTWRYMSPEILEGSVDLKNNRYMLPADVYSLALLLWEIWMCCSDFTDGTLSWYIFRIQVVCSRPDVSFTAFLLFLITGRVAPQHQLPYEFELGASVSTETLILHVCDMGMRPSIPQHWEVLSQVFLNILLMRLMFCD